jgi:hypothetical protein
MTDSSSWWTELRYTCSQALPEPDGVRDELDGLVLWTVEAVQCFHDRDDQVVARSDVAVFDLEADLDLTVPAEAYGNGIARAARLVLTTDGRLREDLGGSGVDAFVLFQQIVIEGVARGAGLAATLAIRDRVASRRSLVGCLPDPPALDDEHPAFFEGVPAALQQRWWDLGLFHCGDGLWLLPPGSGA